MNMCAYVYGIRMHVHTCIYVYIILVNRRHTMQRSSGSMNYNML